ncbi:MAG: bifunctional precorrin-2 dehydrogenase/sirohydrochlorin ferrochelatase [Desulforhabdus sp.]|jgi:precorrin-2 dehydrogenase/sirohydrochlorin ferrochelatase|nr:bifunctional precorrin-2 dehydrogenase/sirohydrochlorin ferrochelatase [Desulforhabdus sp.]
METENKDSCSLPYYPIFLSMAGKVSLVVGGGAVGERKIKGLLEHGASVRLVARDLTPWLAAQKEKSHLTFIGEVYEDAQLDHIDLVFAVTSDIRLNRLIADDARKRRLWCNMATEPELGGFILPAVFQHGPLSVAVSTSGLSPAFARKIRDKIKQSFGPEWTFTLMMLGKLRTMIQSKNLPSSENQQLFNRIADLPLIDWIGGEQWDVLLKGIHEICHPWLTMEELEQIMARA